MFHGAVVASWREGRVEGHDLSPLSRVRQGASLREQTDLGDSPTDTGPTSTLELSPAQLPHSRTKEE